MLDLGGWTDRLLRLVAESLLCIEQGESCWYNRRNARGAC